MKDKLLTFLVFLKDNSFRILGVVFALLAIANVLQAFFARTDGDWSCAIYHLVLACISFVLFGLYFVLDQFGQFELYQKPAKPE